MAEFSSTFTEEFKLWHEHNNSLIVLSVKSERKLWELSNKLKLLGLKVAEFKEPDIGNELTSIAIVPDDRVKKLCSGIPLAGKTTNEGAQERLDKKFKVIEDMMKFEQRPNQTILQHGESVRDHLFDLISFLKDPHHKPKYIWRIPGWALQNSRKLVEKLPDAFTLEKHTTLHDCGKMYCIQVDEEGKVHYPNHSESSAKLFKELYQDEEKAAWLIQHDMDLHLLTSVNSIENYNIEDINLLSALLLTSLSELHSNAELFGGIQSDSFKIKYKRLDKVGNNLIKRYF